MLLHEKIKKLRLEKGWSQVYVAEHIDIEQSDYSKIENGKIKPDISKIIKLANLHEIDINNLLEYQLINNVNNGENYTNNNYGFINQLKVQEQENTDLKEEINKLKNELNLITQELTFLKNENEHLKQTNLSLINKLGQ